MRDIRRRVPLSSSSNESDTAISPQRESSNTASKLLAIANGNTQNPDQDSGEEFEFDLCALPDYNPETNNSDSAESFRSVEDLATSNKDSNSDKSKKGKQKATEHLTSRLGSIMSNFITGNRSSSSTTTENKRDTIKTRKPLTIPDFHAASNAVTNRPMSIKRTAASTDVDSDRRSLYGLLPAPDHLPPPLPKVPLKSLLNFRKRTCNFVNSILS